MKEVQAAAMLYAHLQVRAPDAKIIVLAPPLSTGRITIAARALAEVAGKAGRLVDISGARPEVWSLDQARASLLSPEGTAVVAAGGLLDSPNALVAAAVADAVVVLVQRGRTTRRDLARARSELERTGAKLVGAFLVD